MNACLLTYAKQLKLEHRNWKVESFSYYAIKRSLQANIQGLVV